MIHQRSRADLSVPEFWQTPEREPDNHAGLSRADRAVPEFWQVDPDRQWVRVGTLIDGAYEFSQFVGSDRIASPTFPELGLTADQVLNAGR